MEKQDMFPWTGSWNHQVIIQHSFLPSRKQNKEVCILTGEINFLSWLGQKNRANEYQEECGRMEDGDTLQSLLTVGENAKSKFI